MWYRNNHFNKKLLFNRLCRFLDISKSMKKNSMEMEINSFARAEQYNFLPEDRARIIILRTLYSTLIENDRLGYLYGLNLYVIIQYMLKHELFAVVSMMFQRLVIKVRFQITMENPRPTRSLEPDAKLYWNQFFDRIDADIRTNGLLSR